MLSHCFLSEPEEQSLNGGEKLKDEISHLLDKIIQLTSQHQNNANVYLDKKHSPDDVTPTSVI
jgi:hypothetical protein